MNRTTLKNFGSLAMVLIAFSLASCGKSDDKKSSNNPGSAGGALATVDCKQLVKDHNQLIDSLDSMKICTDLDKGLTALQNYMSTYTNTADFTCPIKRLNKDSQKIEELSFTKQMVIDEAQSIKTSLEKLKKDQCQA